MDTFKFTTIEELNAPVTTSKALIDTRKYIGGWLFFNVTRCIFHEVVDKLERLHYQGSTIDSMKRAYNWTVGRIKKLNAPQRAINAYIKDIHQATQGAIYDELQG